MRDDPGRQSSWPVESPRIPKPQKTYPAWQSRQMPQPPSPEAIPNQPPHPLYIGRQSRSEPESTEQKHQVLRLPWSPENKRHLPFRQPISAPAISLSEAMPLPPSTPPRQWSQYRHPGAVADAG